MLRNSGLQPTEVMGTDKSSGHRQADATWEDAAMVSVRVEAIVASARRHS